MLEGQAMEPPWLETHGAIGVRPGSTSVAAVAGAAVHTVAAVAAVAGSEVAGAEERRVLPVRRWAAQAQEVVLLRAQLPLHPERMQPRRPVSRQSAHAKLAERPVRGLGVGFCRLHRPRRSGAAG